MIGVETLEGVPESPVDALSNAGSSVSTRERLGENEMQKRGRSSTRGADGRDEPTMVSVAGGLDAGLDAAVFQLEAETLSLLPGECKVVTVKMSQSDGELCPDTAFVCDELFVQQRPAPACSVPLSFATP